MTVKLKWWLRTYMMQIVASICWLLGPKFAARLTARSIRYIPGKNGVTFLVMMRPSFDKDIAALVQHTDFGFVIVQNGFTRFQQVFVPRDRREQTYYQTAQKPFSGAEDPQAIYADALLEHAARYATINGVLTANIDYWQDVGLKYHCNARDLVFGVLCRENAVIPQIVTLNYKRYRDAAYKFTGDFIVMAGATSAQMFRDAQVAPSERIYSSGLPRYDVWHDTMTDIAPVTRSFVTLLTFTHGYAADKTFTEVLDRFVAIAHASKDPTLTFLIKTKDADDTRILQDKLQGRLQSNIRIDHTIAMTQALSGSRVIVGYNSLSLIDALISGSKIIVPGWGECLIDGNMCMYPQTPQSEQFMRYATSPQALHDALQSFVDAPTDEKIEAPMSAGMQAYVSQYVTYMPGQLNSTAFAEIALDHVQRTSHSIPDPAA